MNVEPVPVWALVCNVTDLPGSVMIKYDRTKPLLDRLAGLGREGFGGILNHESIVVDPLLG
jgi:hypothetical protein